MYRNQVKIKPWTLGGVLIVCVLVHPYLGVYMHMCIYVGLYCVVLFL